MAHVWWHTCLTAGDPTGGTPQVKVPEGKRGNVMALFRIPHDWSEGQKKAALDRADDLVMELVDLFRQPNENIVFNPMQGKPTPIDD